VAPEIRKVGVVGLGTMGAGIAQLGVQAGVPTVGREVTSELAERGRGTIEGFLSKLADKGKLSEEQHATARAALTVTNDLADLADCDLVIEAIVEQLEPKRELFRTLEGILRPDAILATNTSALSVTEIAAAVERPGRVVGMHFFNPAPLMPLVEIVRAQRTDEAVVDAAYAYAQRIGKEPIRCNDTPGFVVNRILIPVLNDAIRVIDEAGVTVEDLDKAMRFGAGWPMGPATLIDLIGVDVQVHASEALWEGLREPRMAPPPRIVNMARAGLLGRKSKHGFYDYS
jgi:3-hydroxybutyryl-CoA dehydrogenase